MQRQSLYLTAHLLQMALDRSKALSIELQRLRSQQYPPTGPQRLIKLAIRTNEQISEELSAILTDQVAVAATPSLDVEISLRAKTSLLAYLHLLMQYVEGAEIQYAPSVLVFPLRRLLRKHLRDFDFIIRASRRYNYCISSLIEGIQKVFSEAGYSSLLAGLPSQFFVIDCPVSETRNVPIYSVFAHEIGHTLYKRHELASSLLPFISIDESALGRLITTVAMQPVEARKGETEATAGDILEKWRIEHGVRFRLQMIMSQWVEELTADALALCLLGPAYFFSFVYFAGPFASMDNPSYSHPPDRMRIEFTCNMLLSEGDRLAYDKVLDEPTRDYIEQWKAYAGQTGVTTPSAEITPYSSIAAQAIGPVLREIMREAKRVMGKRRYTPKSFQRDVPLLCENLANGIPPNEIMDDWATGQPRIAQAESILNAGWVYLISRDDRYAKLLGVSDQWTITNKLFDLVSKGLEYAEIQRRWGR